jgi:hypothetical protein
MVSETLDLNQYLQASQIGLSIALGCSAEGIVDEI